METSQRMDIDERVKLALFASYTIWLVLVNEFSMLALISGALLILAMIVSPTPLVFLGRWFRLFPAGLIVLLVYWAFAPAEPRIWFTVFGLRFGPEGFSQGLFIGARLLGFILGGMFLYEISSPEKSARAFVWFLQPLRVFKVPIYLLYYIAWFTARFVPVLTDEARYVGLAQRARGARLTGPLQLRLTGLLSLIIPVFAAAARRSDRFALALEARGFNTSTYHRRYLPHRLKAFDILSLICLLIAWIGLIIWRWGRIG